MDLQLKNKVIMLAAASEGLGYGIAKCLAEESCHLSLASRDAEKLQQAVQVLKKNSSIKVRGYTMDATMPATISNWAQQTLVDFQRIDGLLINAGGPPYGNFDAFNVEDWHKAFELTLMSAVHMIHAVLPTLRKQKAGSILAITSSYIKEPNENMILSNVFRSGVVALVKSLSRQLAKEGIRVNNLVPGVIQTGRIEKLEQAHAQQQGISAEAITQQRVAAIPMGRYGTVEEFGRAGAFLLSPAASYITGETLVVDGGAMRTVW